MPHFMSSLVLLSFICLLLVNVGSSLKLGAKNVLSRNVTKWRISTILVEVEEYHLEYCGGYRSGIIQCRIITGITTQTRDVCNQYIETELYCHPGFYESEESCENDCEKEKGLIETCSREL
ncbi:uncharacterized protein [Antedon mediterranea]|uniref:uncharacterized protein n=1 Tax=Antedon mediterranea TaxID=105859 RepID=UPI003AF76EBB